MTALLESLTDEQLAAVQSDAPWTSVQAGPGSGKSRVITARVVHLIESGVHPADIGTFCFTRAATAEIRHRVASAVGAVASLVTIETFHSFSARQVVPQTMRVATEVEMAAAVRSLYEGPTRRSKHAVPGIEALERAIIAHEASPEDTPFANAVRLVRTRLLHAGLVPTWDLVPACLNRFDERLFEFVLVDEAQDATENEACLAWLLRAEGGQLFTVGDPRQAIMGFRGGSRSAFLRRIPEPATERTLTQTFRFGPAIAYSANRIARRFGADAIVGATVDDGAVSVGSIRDAIDVALAEEITFDRAAILCRTHFECASIVAELGPDVAVHVQRDPYLDHYGQQSDVFRQVADGGRIAVATAHGAKGREWDAVILAPSLHPDSDQRDEEELRVLYVAATRARRMLAIVRPENANDTRSTGD